MTRAHRPTLLLALLLTFGLSACAPVILGRTPTPVPIGETETSLALGYPVVLTLLTVCDGLDRPLECSPDGLGPAYWPTPYATQPYGCTGER